MSHFDEYINNLTDSITAEDFPSTYDALLTEAKITTQKIQEHTKQILTNFGDKKHTLRVGKLVLMCAKLETVNANLIEIRHEYNL
ncbi:MAG: hypothetical protein IJ375_05405 [Oscillospiraceae bacterium]|nr:hypothetical protein [Oscillospiraceae bacterium]